MPYANEHAARIHEPSRYDSFARVDNSHKGFENLPAGVSIILGIKDGKSEAQAYRFNRDKWTVESAKKWLKDHAIAYIEFEPAAGTRSVDEDCLVALGAEVRSVDGTPGKIGGYGLRYGNPSERDLLGTYFKPTTNYGPRKGDGQQITMNHCYALGKGLEELGQRFIGDGAHVEADEIGLFVSTVLNLADKYEAWVYKLAQQGKFRWSSGTAERMIRDDGSGGITNWPIIEWALTPLAGEPRLPMVAPLRSVPVTALDMPDAQADTPLDEGVPDAADTRAVTAANSQNLGDVKMDSEELKKLIGETVAAAMAANAPVQPSGGFANAPDKTGEQAIRSAAQVLRFGKLEDNEALIMKEVYGTSYADAVDTQTAVFKKYIRKGTRNMTADDERTLQRQLWPIQAVKDMLVDGLTVGEIRATMIEGADVLGGYAVPPQLASAALQRLNGLTAVRGGGALIVQTAANMIEWLKVTGGSDVYTSALRGVWGNETQTPTAKNLTFGLLEIPVSLYTYKVPMSLSLIEDASNVVEITMNTITDTLAIDEDVAFLTGDGANKPRGITPGNANSDSYAEVVTADADDITWAGLGNLRHGIASQYRGNGRNVLIGNGQSASDIENLLDGLSNAYIDTVDVGTKVRGMSWRESEAMPDASAGTFPLIHADLSGYAIVERLGLSVQRYNDSNTGINVVEFHVRRRIGGHVIQPWKFAVQKVAAS
jgi:HK97 family phage major capsid protein